jgi:transcriptional regulator with XRE-family HTH domain
VTLGQLIIDARRKAGLSQKELAARILKEDRVAISASYLNDIEHDRRSPSSEAMIKQLAKALDLAPELLFFSAGRLPSELTKGADQRRVVKAFDAFRKALKQK